MEISIKVRSSPIRVVAVIPARGGSKGIPGKNLRSIGGVPMIVRTVRAALAASRVDCVIVSSDDDEILRVSAEAGASIIRRPAELATDDASSESALLHALGVLEAMDIHPERLVFLQCTSPFLGVRDVEALIAALDDRKFAAALTVSPNHGFLWRRDGNGGGVGINHDAAQPRKRRQDLAPEYRENGAGYAMFVDAFSRARHRFCGAVALVETGLPVVEIDESDDLDIVDAILRSRERRRLDPHIAQRLKVLVTDFDGVHTDDHVFVGDDGGEQVRCSRSDGLGISMLRAAGINVLILSKEDNPVVTRRGAKLKALVLQGIDDKQATLAQWLDDHGIGFDEAAYIGNDVNDLACMGRVAVAFAPADAHSALDGVGIALSRNGGNGAIREACDLILAYRGLPAAGR